jgi:hypothetical protein
MRAYGRWARVRDWVPRCGLGLIHISFGYPEATPNCPRDIPATPLGFTPLSEAEFQELDDLLMEDRDGAEAMMLDTRKDASRHVMKEVAMARAVNVKVVQVIGYRGGDYTPVPNAGHLYAWNWPNLQKHMS